MVIQYVGQNEIEHMRDDVSILFYLSTDEIYLILL